MNSKPKNINEYCRDQLKHGNFKVIASETRRNGAEGLIPRADLHSAEIAREQRFLSLASRTNKFCCVAIDPDTGLFGLYQIFQPNGELAFEDPAAQTDPASPEGAVVARAEAARMRNAGSTASALANSIIAAEIKDYESLIEKIPKDVDTELTLVHLKHAKGKLMEIESSEGVFHSGGYEQLTDSLPCRENYTVIADICKTERGFRHNPSITFVPIQHQPDGCRLPPMFENFTSIQADIATSDRRASLQFIHFSLFQDMYVKLELELAYAIATGRWSVKVVDILDSKEVIGNAKSAQMVFNDW